VTTPDGVEVLMANDLPLLDGAWRLPDLAWGAEAWAVLKLQVPATALPRTGDRLAVLRVQVQGLSLEGEPVRMERVGLALPVLAPGAFDGLSDDELVSRRLMELAAAAALTQVRAAAAQRDWTVVERLLDEARAQFAGNSWVESVLASMAAIAASREREMMMKEAAYSSSKLQSRLASKQESANFMAEAESRYEPSYLRRKPTQGKGEV
jgi:Ca-activated chloride channel family protein